MHYSYTRTCRKFINHAIPIYIIYIEYMSEERIRKRRAEAGPVGQFVPWLTEGQGTVRAFHTALCTAVWRGRAHSRNAHGLMHTASRPCAQPVHHPQTRTVSCTAVQEAVYTHTGLPHPVCMARVRKNWAEHAEHQTQHAKIKYNSTLNRLIMQINP